MKDQKPSLIMKGLAKMAKSAGDQSVRCASLYWYHQPKVPECMKKEKKEK